MSPAPYGYAAEFAAERDLLQAVRLARAEGYARCEACTPYAVMGLAEELGLKPSRLPLLMLLGGTACGAAILALEWYSAVIAYPVNVGGRPAASWPAFMPAVVEMTLLGAALAGFCAFLVGSGLPRLRHPVFNAAAAARASSERFLLLIRADDPRFEETATRVFLETLGPLSIEAVDG